MVHGEDFVEVFESAFQADNNVAATLAWRPLGDKSDKLYLHLYEEICLKNIEKFINKSAPRHFSYIKDIQMVTKSWRCSNFDKLFNHLGHYNLHEKHGKEN